MIPRWESHYRNKIVIHRYKTIAICRYSWLIDEVTKSKILYTFFTNEIDIHFFSFEMIWRFYCVFFSCVRTSSTLFINVSFSSTALVLRRLHFLLVWVYYWSWNQSQIWILKSLLNLDIDKYRFSSNAYFFPPFPCSSERRWVFPKTSPSSWWPFWWPVISWLVLVSLRFLYPK